MQQCRMPGRGCGSDFEKHRPGLLLIFRKKSDMNVYRVAAYKSNTWKEVAVMKIGEAQQAYRGQVQAYQSQRSVLAKQLEEVKKRMKYSPETKEKDEQEAATLELTLEALDEKKDEYQEYLKQLSDRYFAYWNAEVAKQQKDASQENAQEMAKIMEVARRLMKGAIVPGADEKKLMEFSMDLYQVAKNIGAMIQRQKREKYDSLWGEKKEKDYADPQETAENAEAGPGAPEIVDVSETMASVSQPEPAAECSI